MIAFFSLLAVPRAAFAVEHALVGGGLARLRGRALATRGTVLFRDHAVGAALSDPRCPARSRLRLGWAAGRATEVALPCAGWARSTRGFRYVARPRAAGGVRSILVADDVLLVRFGGPGLRFPTASPSFLEVGLEIGDTAVCGRFSDVDASTPGLLSARGRSEPCRLPPPNFVVVVLDDARFDGVDHMTALRDRIAAEGVSFDNAFTPNPVCAPSRASILTGRYALRHRTFQVSGPIGGADTFRANGTDRRTLAVWLREAGYRTGLFGKYLNAYGVTERDKGPGRTFYVPPGWKRWWAFVTPEHYGGLLGGSYSIVEEDSAVTSYTDHSTDAEYSTDVSADRLRTFVGDAVEAGEPFFAYWAPNAPHGEPDGPLPAPAERHVGAFASLPPWRPASWNEDDVTDKPRWVQERQSRSADPSGSGPIVRALTDLGRQAQYETLLAVDEQLDALLDQLAALGVDRDTFILVTSDNGVGWGEHQVWFGKGCPYEECQRVPMIVRYPRLVAGGSPNVAAPVLNIDVAPTLAALAGVAVPAAVDGRSLQGWLGGRSPAWRTDYLLEHWREDRRDELAYSGQVRDGDRLRVFHGDPRAEPRPSVVFEFDSGGGVAPGSLAVAIGGDADASFAALRDAVTAAVPGLQAVLETSAGRLTVRPVPQSERESVYLWEEVDQGESFAATYPRPDYFGVRDVARGLTWVEYETGERELYDLAEDPQQLDNRADDPAYGSVRMELEARLAELLGEIESR